VLFVLIALFAKFEIISNKSTFTEIVIGIVSILFGAFIWWTTLTLIVSKFRNKLNLNGLKKLNKITGIIILLIGLFGAIFSLLET
jgi:hypothetical protein